MLRFPSFGQPPDSEHIFRRTDHFSFFAASSEGNRVPAVAFAAGMDWDVEERYRHCLAELRSGTIAEIPSQDRSHYHTVWDTLRDEEGRLNIDTEYLERFSEFLFMVTFDLADLDHRPDYVETLP